MKINKYCYFIDVILKLIASTFCLSTMKIELWKTYYLYDLVKPQYALGC